VEIGNVKILLEEVEEGLRLIETANQTLERMALLLISRRIPRLCRGLAKAEGDKSAKDFLDKQWALSSNRSRDVRSEAYVVRARFKAALGTCGAAADARVALDFIVEQRLIMPYQEKPQS
jgi:hypothetical protein